MTLYEREQERLEAAIEKGIEIGEAKGRSAEKVENRKELLTMAKDLLKSGQGIDSLRTIMKLTDEEVAYVLNA